MARDNDWNGILPHAVPTARGMRRALRRDRHMRQFVRKEFLLFPAKPSTETRSHKVFGEVEVCSCPIKIFLDLRFSLN